MIVINGKYAQNPKNKHKQDYKKKLEYNKPRAQYQTIETKRLKVELMGTSIIL